MPNTDMTMEASLKDLSGYYQTIPMAQAMQLEVVGFAGDRLRMRAPLAPNINDKGCAFGGSLTSLLTIAGWSLATLELARAGFEADVFVADSTIRYLAPLYDDLEVEAWLAEDESWEGFIGMFRQRGKARCQIHARAGLPQGGDATTLQGRFVALARQAKP